MATTTTNKLYAYGKMTVAVACATNNYEMLLTNRFDVSDEEGVGALNRIRCNVNLVPASTTDESGNTTTPEPVYVGYFWYTTTGKRNSMSFSRTDLVPLADQKTIADRWIELIPTITVNSGEGETATV